MEEMYLKQENIQDVNSEAGLRLLEKLLESGKRIKTRFYKNDKTPIYDGSFNLLRGGYITKKDKLGRNRKSLDTTIIRKFDVQVKTITELNSITIGENKGKYYYRLDTSVLNHVKIKSFPSIFYFVVDLKNERVFYLYIDYQFLENFDYDVTSKETTYYFSDENIISNIELFYFNLDKIYNDIINYHDFSKFLIKNVTLNEFNNIKIAIYNSIYGTNRSYNNLFIIEKYSIDFLNTLLCDNHFDKNEFSKLSSLIIHKHEIALRKIIETRLNIISKYWQGFDVCDDLNNLLSATEKNEKIPTWIINDIAIDLRNNTPFGRNNRGQSKLDESPEKLHFPILDRISNNINNNILKKYQDYFSKKVYFGNMIDDFILEDVALYFCVSLLYGSITHLLIVKRVIRDIFDASYKMNKSQYDLYLIVRYDILFNDDKHLKTIIENNSDVCFGKIDFNKINQSIEMLPRENYKIRARLLLFSSFCYLLPDLLFKKLYKWFMEFTLNAIDSGKPFIDNYSIMKNVFTQFYLRFQNDDIYNVLINAFESKYSIIRDFASVTFYILDLKKISDSCYGKMKELIIKYLNNGECEKITYFKENVVFRFCMNSIDENADLMEILKKNYNSFYNEYKIDLNKQKSDADFIEEITKCKNQIKARLNLNKNVSITFSDNPFLTLCRIFMIKKGNISLEGELLSSLIDLLNVYLISDNKSAKEKCYCINLLIILNNYYKNEIDWLELYNNLNSKIDSILSVDFISPFELYSDKSVSFLWIIFKTIICKNNDNLFEILYYSNSMYESDILISFRTILDIKEIDNKFLETNCSFFTQFAITYTLNENSDISNMATRLLCLLLSNNSDVILKHFIKIFDSINFQSRRVIIETLISRKDINSHIKNSLIEKGKSDLNYYVRECAAK